MKVLFPRNIKKGFFSGLSFTIGPITVNLIQLFVIVVGLMFSFLTANYLLKHGNNKFFSIAAASPFTLIACAIAFFNVSEMGLIQFIAKVARTNFFDAPIKYQVNTESIDKTEIIIKKNHSIEQPKKIIFKTQKNINPSKIQRKIEESGFL